MDEPKRSRNLSILNVNNKIIGHFCRYAEIKVIFKIGYQNITKKKETNKKKQTNKRQQQRDNHN